MAQRQVERQLGALVEAGMILASELELDTLLQRVADLSREVIGARYAAVGVVNENHELVRFIHSGIDQETVDKIGHLPEGRGVLGVLVEEKRPLRLREISDHARSYGFPDHHPPMHSFLGVPIVVRDRAFGRLYITEKQGAGEFSKDDERIAMTFAAQAGVAIENARLYEEVRSRGGQLARRVAEISSVERVSDLLITGHSLDQVLRSVVEEASKLMDASRSTLVLLDERSGELVVRQASGALPEGLLGQRLPGSSSKAEAVMRRMKAEVVANLQVDAEVDGETLRRLGGPTSGAFAPMIVGGRGIGTLGVYDPADGREFSEDELGLLQLLANQAAIAIENDRLTAALRDLAVLEERDRISKDLHDGVIQSIYSVGLSLQGSISLLERDPELVRKRMDAAIAQLDNVVRDVRSYIFELQPKMVEEHGLEAALRAMIRDLEVNTLASAESDIDPEAVAGLSTEQQSNIVQVAREVLSNIARHAHATEVWLTLSSTGDGIRLAIADDGVGFDPDTVRRGYGLRNIQERARKLGGEMLISPREPEGTVHELRIPIGGQEAERGG